MKDLKDYLMESVNGHDFQKKNDEFLNINYMIKNIDTVEDLFVYIFAQLGLNFETPKNIRDAHFKGLTSAKLKNAVKKHKGITDDHPFFITDGYDLLDDIDWLVDWLQSGEAYYLDAEKTKKHDGVEFVIGPFFEDNDEPTIIFIPGY